MLSLFKLYNTFYCGVSGSLIDPNRPDSGYDIIQVKDRNGEEITGKYYRCCSPCLCDVMKYALVENYTVELEDGSKSTPETVFKVDTKAEKQVLDSDSEDSDSSDDSDSESEEEVKAKPPPKKGKNTKKSAWDESQWLRDRLLSTVILKVI